MDAISSSLTFSRTWSTGRGFCEQLAVGERRYPGLHFNGRVICHARPNERNVSSFSFHKYSQESKEPGFFERLVHACHVLFPSRPKPVSNAEIAKQRLKMILISDRCAISDEARRKIVDNVVGALSSFVEIESEEKVQLNVSADPDLGTLYSVIVPVRRVKPQYQDYNDALKSMNYGDAFGKMRTLDVSFEYPNHVDKE
eukprot:c19046_g1_i1 orf=157-753(+)